MASDILQECYTQSSSSAPTSSSSSSSSSGIINAIRAHKNKKLSECGQTSKPKLYRVSIFCPAIEWNFQYIFVNTRLAVSRSITLFTLICYIYIAIDCIHLFFFCSLPVIYAIYWNIDIINLKLLEKVINREFALLYLVIWDFISQLQKMFGHFKLNMFQLFHEQ